MINQLSLNIQKLTLMKGLEYAWFPIPTIILFYQSKGLALESALILKTVLSIAIFIGEIPSGYLADRFGRKLSIIIGGFLWIIGWLIYCTQATMAWFIGAEILAGLAASLISGADTALLYDTLVQLKSQAQYRKIQGQLVAISGFSEAFCGIIGAWIASFNLVYPFYLQTILILVYTLIAITLVEPQIPQLNPQNPGELNLLKIVRFALWDNPSVQGIIGFSATLGTGTFLMVWLSQEYLKTRDFPIASFGIFWALFHLVMGAISLKAEAIEDFLGSKKAFLILVLSLGLAYLLLGLVSGYGGIILIAVIYLVRGLKTPLILNYLNHQISSELRATVISINSFAFRLGVVIIAPLAGWLTEFYGFDRTLIMLGIIFLFFGNYCWYQLVKLKII